MKEGVIDVKELERRFLLVRMNEVSFFYAIVLDDGGIEVPAMYAGMAKIAEQPCAGDGGKERYAIDQARFRCLRLV
ncbi:hypothetical protein L195_g035875 [Trifolium pratense]|uniref:Uncharacterized protein n=1 Tax=Trifolium pratense TaxID=57577 RepID=A0A2K3LMX0_TRIPR|nr:hypothetical protein L195_g035875 [Trifolium pratense]